MSDSGEPLFSDLNMLLKLLEAYSKVPLEGPLDPEAEKQLAALEEQMALFREALAPELSKVVDPRNLTPGEKRMVAKWGELGLIALGQASALEAAKQGPEKAKRKKDGKPSDREVQERKKKFKKIGGDQKWKKL